MITLFFFQTMRNRFVKKSSPCLQIQLELDGVGRGIAALQRHFRAFAGASVGSREQSDII